MRSEPAKTLLFALAAAVLVFVAGRVEPDAARPDILSDEGEPLFPALRDVTAVKSIEVVDYDEAEAVARPLKVEFRNGRWLIPSHNDYPAEAGDRLAKTAAALLDLRKDIVVSDRIEDHGRHGVIDPLDMNVAGLTGRGKRVTLKDAQGGILADMTIGKPVEGRPGFRYVRLPGRKRVYGVRTAADPSARFEDWVESNLLRLPAGDIRKITLNDYSIDESFGRVASSERVVLTRDGGQWKAEGTRRVGQAAMQAAAAALAQLRISGARPKPRTLAEQLRQGQFEMTLEAVMSLRQRGFFVTPAGQLLSKEGEIAVETAGGLLYTLRLGEIVSGSAGPESENDAGVPRAAPSAAEQDRYLFVTVSYDARRGAGGENAARALSRRFADWYYVISGADFAKLKMR